MGAPAAKQGDKVKATDTHIVLVPGTPPVPTPLPHDFLGIINGNLSTNVKIMGQPAATVGSTAQNQPPHVPTPPGTSFTRPPTNLGTIRIGSQSVRINGKAAARNGDKVETCNDPIDALMGTIIAAGTVSIG